MEWMRQYKDKVSNDSFVYFEAKGDCVDLVEISAPDVITDKRGDRDT